MKGLKPVSRRRNDALTRVGWGQFETLLADHYRRQGYQVVHVGTGATGAQFDGGIDLKLRRDAEYIVVQCKHWNAMKVTHNAVHELLGIMVNQSATGAILVTSGEFTKAAVEAATRQGHVRLIDGDELRAMLGSVSASPMPALGGTSPVDRYGTGARSLAVTVGERLLSAAEDRIRYGGSRNRGRSRSATAMIWLVVVKIVFALLIGLMLMVMIRAAVAPLLKIGQPTVTPPTPRPLPVPSPPPQGYVAATAGAAPASPGTQLQAMPRLPTQAEIRESQRKADEAIKVLEKNTPEM